MRICLRTFILLLGIICLSQLNAQQILPHPDNSPTTDHFLLMKLPPIHQIWGVTEYEQGFRLLDKIHEMDKYSLPRYQSPWSGAVFARLTATENFDYLVDTTINIRIRLEQLQTYSMLPSALLNLYQEYDKEEERFGTEVTQCLLFLAHFTHKALLLIKELERWMLKTYGERSNDSVSQLEKAHLETLMELLTVFDEKRVRFDEQVRVSYAKALRQQLPEFLHPMTPSNRQVLLNTLDKLIAKAPSKAESQQLQQLKKACSPKQ